jgi:hypothetical protein
MLLQHGNVLIRRRFAQQEMVAPLKQHTPPTQLKFAQNLIIAPIHLYVAVVWGFSDLQMRAANLAAYAPNLYATRGK